VKGRVVTFYSYKGGVGRSFALANIGVVLAQWGYRVLMVDWDIEAPGLNHYFHGRFGEPDGGVIDFLDDCRRGMPHSWERYAAPIVLDSSPHNLYLMPAEAGPNVDYAALVQDLDWDRLYEKHSLGSRIEEMREQWVDAFDFVLVDSRTGVTDFSGLTTAQLPDVLAFMFTANEQSLGGCAHIARRAMEARRRMSVDRPALLPLPIPGRFEQREEYERAQEWRSRFQYELQPFFNAWASPGVDTLKLIDLITIPYVPRWTFGEELAVLVEASGLDGVRSPSHSVSYTCETIAALLAHGFEHVDLLTSSRDEFVHGARYHSSTATKPKLARSTAPVVLILCREENHQTKKIQDLLLDYLGNRHLGVIISGSDSNLKGIREELNTADAYIVIIDKDSAHSTWLTAIFRLILRSSTFSAERKPIVPVVTKDAENLFLSSVVADFHAVILNEDLDMTPFDSVFERLRINAA
jgi:cellulose biosynthesis protein BcsQ